MKGTSLPAAEATPFIPRSRTRAVIRASAAPVRAGGSPKALSRLAAMAFTWLRLPMPKEASTHSRAKAPASTRPASRPRGKAPTPAER